MNNISLFLTAIGGSIQALETAAQQVLTQRSIDVAIGEQLDDLGVIVGQPRLGLDDATFRSRLRARIRVHRSDGLLEELITITSLVVADPAAFIRLEQQQILTVTVHVENVALSDMIADTTLFAFLLKAVAAGVRIILQSGTTAPATWFRLDVGPGLDAGYFTDSRG